MPLVQNEREARKAIWPLCPASAAFHDVSYLGSWCQTGTAQTFILGLSMFVAYCFHSHALTVLVITQLLSAFCLLPSPFMCSWFQMLYLVPDISVLTLWCLGPEHSLLCKTFLWIAGCYQDACPLSTGHQEHPLIQGQQLKMSRQYPLGVETASPEGINGLVCAYCCLKTHVLKINVLPWKFFQLVMSEKRV